MENTTGATLFVLPFFFSIFCFFFSKYYNYTGGAPIANWLIRLVETLDNKTGMIFMRMFK